MSEQTTTWPDLALDLIERLANQGGEVTCEFVNLVVQVPNAVGAGAQHADWRLNGALKLRIKDAVKGEPARGVARS